MYLMTCSFWLTTTKRARKVFFLFFPLSLSSSLLPPSLPPIGTHLLLPALPWPGLLVIVYPVQAWGEGREFFLVFVSDFDCSSLVAPFGQTRN